MSLLENSTVCAQIKLIPKAQDTTPDPTSTILPTAVFTKFVFNQHTIVI